MPDIVNYEEDERALRRMRDRQISSTEKADAFDRLITEIRYRQPAVDLAFAQRGSGWRTEGPQGDEITRFLAAFDALAGVVKQHALQKQENGDKRLLKRIREGL